MNQIREALPQHAEEVVALLVGQGEAACEHEPAAVIRRRVHDRRQVGVVVAHAGQDRHAARAR